MTSQSYILTLFEDHLENGAWQAFHDAIFQDGKVAYIGSQLERCPNSGRVHWQAFVHFHRQSKQRGTYFKKFSPKIHFEKCGHVRAAAINYGIKEETRLEGPKEDGKKPEPRSKNGPDWDLIKSAILNDTKEDIPFELVLRYHLEQRWDGLRSFYAKDNRASLPMFLGNPWSLILPSKIVGKRRHYWIYSRQPNVGKTTKFAKPLSEGFRARLLVGDTTYLGVESGDECLIFDEYNSQIFKYPTLNAMCDGTYTYRRFYRKPIGLKDPLIIILSNQSIRDLYPIRYDLIEARFIEHEIV